MSEDVGWLKKAPVAASIAAFLASIGALSAVTRLPAGRVYRGAPPLPAEIAARFAMGQTLGVSTSPARGGDGGTRLKAELLTADVDGDTRTVVFEYWPPPAGPAPAVTVIPILEGGYDMARLLAAWFASKGFAVVMVHRPTTWLDPANPVERLESLLRRGVVDQRLALRWLAARPEVDSSRLYVLGISLGAILGLDLTAVEPAVDGATLVMAGGDLPGIIGSSIERPVARYIAARLAKDGVDLDRWQARARKVLVSDPLALAPYVDAGRVLLVLSRFDRHVPTVYQEALRNAMGAPRAVMIPTGHYTAALYWYYIRGLARDFFRSRTARSGSDSG